MNFIILIATLLALAMAEIETEKSVVEKCYDYKGSCDFRSTPLLQALAQIFFGSTGNSEIVATSKAVGCWCQDAEDPRAPNQQWLTCPNFPFGLIVKGLYRLQNNNVQFIYCHCIKGSKCGVI